ncbi:MAG: sialidase family protein [Ignavibacteriota bacterium]
MVSKSMRCSTLYLLSIILVLSASELYAQRSCVFLDEIPTLSHGEEGFDRPRPTLRRIPKTLNTVNILKGNAAPDFPNINVSLNLTQDQDETTIAINPRDPNNIIIGANDYRSDSSLSHFETFDGGKTWSWGSLRSGWDFAANPTDPSVAFNLAGKAFYCYGRAAQDRFQYPINEILQYTSVDGGNDWTLPSRILLDSTGDKIAAILADKYYITIENNSASPYKNRIYVAWVEYDLNRKSRIRLTYSSNDGASWSDGAFITTTGNYQGPIPVCGSSGEVYVAYENIDTTKREIRFARSLDGGKTFPLDKKIANYVDLGPLDPPGDSLAHPTIKGGLRVNSFPSIAANHSHSHDGAIYLTWAAMGADNRHHIYFVQSGDAGISWSNPRTIEGDPSPIATDKFFPWIAVDDSTGDIGIAYYDSRTDSTNILTDLFMLFSKDGGQNFTPKRISGASSDVYSTSSGLTNFFGDYIGLAARNKNWYPAWTDTRVGYDQDIYAAIVRPYSPSAPKNFVAIEDSISHLPDLTWEYTPATTFGAPIGNFIFRLKRLDGGLSIDLPNTARAYNDLTAVKNTDYIYSLQVITTDQDTSVTQYAPFSPRANNEPLPPGLTSARALPNGFEMFFRVPDKNIAGTVVHDLYRIYFLRNGIVSDSFTLTDSARGKIFSYIFSDIQPDGYQRIELAASTRNADYDTVLSVLSEPKWLYAGVPLDSYTENFIGSKNIFTPYSWDTTRAGGQLPGNFINDSLPDIPYNKNVDTWFVLPPVTMSAAAHTLEFVHIALVTPGDSAAVEASTDDGVHFSNYTFFDQGSHPFQWGNSIATSTSAAEQIPLKNLIGKDAIIRFRLLTHSSLSDGWFIDSIHFTDALSVKDVANSGSFRAGLIRNPLHVGEFAKMRLFSDKAVSLTVNIYSMLGKKQSVILDGRRMAAGDNELEFSTDTEGCFFYEVIARTAIGEVRRYGKYIVIN